KYFVPCPHCNHEHEIVWANVRFTWTVDPKNGKKIAVSKGAKLYCPKCDKPFTEAQRHTAVANGRWIATRPEVTDYAGFHISRLYSPL
ncbi:phage terminase large subunit family protein, partial [Escherichia coli]